MNTIEQQLQLAILNLIQKSTGNTLAIEQIQIQPTRKEFQGDLTLVVFPFTKLFGKNPEQTAQEMGEKLLVDFPLVTAFNVIKGFLNLSIHTDYWLNFLHEASRDSQFGLISPKEDSRKMMVEFSSPNTNKPLHLGHIRNILLGDSITRILRANGHKVYAVNLVNDRGIHICKSMIAWKEYGQGETPENSGKKGDHLVGDFYVRYDMEFRKQVSELVEKGMDKELAEREAPIFLKAQEMLRNWELGESETIQLWKKMNSWVYAGFDKTYADLGIQFDTIYYESETYKLGKEFVLNGLKEGKLEQLEDQSIWADLTSDGLDKKILLRSDGTSVYMTQDIGTAYQRFTDFHIDEHVYVVGNEQNYHFQALKLVLKKLGFDFADRLFHLSYGMVELPDGKMKSREGKVVDADDLIAEMLETAHQSAQESEKLGDLPEAEYRQTIQMVALAALKYFILKVDPKKNMTFSPQESIDFNGNTGPFIQYTHARIQSVVRMSGKSVDQLVLGNYLPNELEISLIKLIHDFPALVKEAGASLSPAIIGNYLFSLAKEFNRFYHEYSILKAELETEKHFRLLIAYQTGKVIRTGLALLGIGAPDKM